MTLIRIYILLFIGLLSTAINSQAQLIERAGQLIQTAFTEAPADTLSAEGRHMRDSVRLHEMALQIQEMKLN